MAMLLGVTSGTTAWTLTTTKMDWGYNSMPKDLTLQDDASPFLGDIAVWCSWRTGPSKCGGPEEAAKEADCQSGNVAHLRSLIVKLMTCRDPFISYGRSICLSAKSNCCCNPHSCAVQNPGATSRARTSWETRVILPFKEGGRRCGIEGRWVVVLQSNIRLRPCGGMGQREAAERLELEAHLME